MAYNSKRSSNDRSQPVDYNKKARMSVDYSNLTSYVRPAGNSAATPFSRPQLPFLQLNNNNMRYAARPAAVFVDSPYFRLPSPYLETFIMGNQYCTTLPEAASTSQYTAEPVKQTQMTPQNKKCTARPNNPKSLRLLTGNVEKVLTTWSRVTRNEPVLFEIYGKIDHVRTSLNSPTLKKFFMSDFGASGPQLPVEFYEMDRPIVELKPGELVRVVGSMRGRILQAYSVDKSSEDELAAIQRAIHVCDRTVAEIARK